MEPEKIDTADLEWQGLSPKDFLPYRPFINRHNPGFCGSYSAAALTHWWTKHRKESPLPMEDLIAYFQPRIDLRLPYRGTFWWDVKAGLNQYWKGLGLEAHFHLLSERIIPKLLEGPNPRPAIVGTVTALGSPYKNHWLLVYAYARDQYGHLWYKAYDNHGNHQVIIPAVSTLSVVWLEERK